MDTIKAQKKQDFLQGIRLGIPIFLGYAAVSFVFGLQALQAGLTPFQAALMSAVNLTSAGQFAALELIATSAPLLELVVLQAIINLRYLLMSTVLSQKVEKSATTFQRMKIAYGVTDEIFAVSVLRKEELRPSFSYGIILISALGWVGGTALGALAGQILPDRLISALGIALYGMFLAIIVPRAKRSRKVLAVVLSAVILSTLFTYVPFLSGISSGVRMILITVTVSALAAFFLPPEGDLPKEEAHE